MLLSMTKAASTSLVSALAPRATIVFQRTPALKHMSAGGFKRNVEPILERVGHPRDSYEVVCLFREPVAWLDSWYRYRSRAGLRRRGDDAYTGDLSFEEFAERYMARDVGGPIVRGRPARFISTGPQFTVEVDRVFALEQPDVWSAWIRGRVGDDLRIEQRNRSSVRSDPDLSPSLRRRLEEHFSWEYDVYERLRATGEWSGARGTVLAPER